MLFNSYLFIFLFLPIVFSLYFISNYYERYNLAKTVVIIGSLIFYGYYNWSYLVIIISSTIFNFLCGRKIIDKKSKIWVITGILVNIGVLFYFKYFNFFIDNVNILFKTNYTFEKILLPLGISFYTFQQISYVVDCYTIDMEKYSFLDYSFFVTFFPQLIAGPIVMHSEILPQLNDERNKNINYENLSKGFLAFSLGLGKKVLLADTFGMFVDQGYANIVSLSSIDAVLVMVAYTFQIYFDFSGYCDMALGLAKMFNIDIPLNFESPYKSYSINEFWSRWHITLTRFFRNYLYIPLGGNRKGTIRTYLNIMVVFFVSGLWHGADWSFVLWGVIHGFFQVINRIFNKQWNKLHKAFQWMITFCIVNVAWIFFRADSISEALSLIGRFKDGRTIGLSDFMLNSLEVVEVDMLEKLFNISHTSACFLFLVILFVIAFFIVLNMQNIKERMRDFVPSVRISAATSFIFAYGVLSLSGVHAFLYFGF